MTGAGTDDGSERLSTPGGRAPRVVAAFGTRPEANKMAPVVAALARTPGIEPLTLVTGQHREQLASSLAAFGLTPDADLDVMTERQTLAGLFARIVPAAAAELERLRADYVLVHGDTTTTFAVALAAHLVGVPVAHVEAGLRSFDLSQPFPEEANRRLTDVITDLDLPPTDLAKRNLLAEGKSERRMVVTGNTAVDAVQHMRKSAKLPERLGAGPFVAVTMHRRENLPVMAGLAAAVAAVAKANPDRLFVYPVHLNPAVREAVTPALSGLPNVVLDEPYDYDAMLALLAAADLIVTDSGGLQEEGAALGVPVAVLRNVTERPEGVAAGVLRLLGNEPAAVRAGLEELLADARALAAMRSKPNPYGDGRAGERIAQAVAWRFGLGLRPRDWVYAGRS
ncbi:MAG: UDP-N-acetylglucosamine 2-epimerase (non-hydrolyzing) [Trueperaceae bacterium]|nr:UDP-N-acetylglucosamine 2-epimerase (non-hydrolyzing) [Trueperaceae bacterium]